MLQIDRREFLGAVVAAGMCGASPAVAQQAVKIKLRPYHLPHVVQYFGGLHLKPEDMRRSFWGKQLTTFTEKAYNEDGFNYVVEQIKSKPQEITIEVVQEFDDICIKCNRRVRDEEGSVWGKSHSCTSSRKPETVEWVNKRNREILDKLGLRFGSVIGLEDLLKLLSERIPAPGPQEQYEKGVTVLRSLLKEGGTADGPADKPGERQSGG